MSYLRNNQNAERVTWVREMKKMVGEEKALVFFLDKKCFYTTGRQIRLKHLPRPPHKLKGIDLKLMFMVFVAQPLPDLDVIPLQKLSTSYPDTFRIFIGVL